MRVRPSSVLRPFIVESLNKHGCQTAAQLAERYNTAMGRRKLLVATPKGLKQQLQPLVDQGRARIIQPGVYGPARPVTLIERLVAMTPAHNTLRHGLLRCQGFAKGRPALAADFGPSELCYATRLAHVKQLMVEGLVYRVRLGGHNAMMIEATPELRQALAEDANRMAKNTLRALIFAY